MVQLRTAPNGLRRYGVVGTGHRAQMYVEAMTGDHADVADLRSWCEPNPARCAFYDAKLVATGRHALPRYEPSALEQMICEERLDAVIITTPDHTHAEMVSRALLAGADVIVEKPLTIDAPGCRQIAEAVRRSGKRLVMTFNYRYSPRNSALREIVADGDIGTVTNVHFEWALDTKHGADYFRRWHRDKRSSGGLFVHKASHHFDLVNWWLDDVPVEVYARGGLHFYGDQGAGIRHARQPRPHRGTGAPPGDPWSLDLTRDKRLEALYLMAEEHDGYLRDRDVFAPGITIEDSLSALVSYRRGATLTYSLTAYAPWEGYRVSITGTLGRAELEVVERGALDVAADGRVVIDPSAASDPGRTNQRRPGERLVVQRHWEAATEVAIPLGAGSHGGGDRLLLRDVFTGARDDPLSRAAGYGDGLQAVAVGIGANESLRTGNPSDLVALGLVADPQCTAHESEPTIEENR